MVWMKTEINCRSKLTLHLSSQHSPDAHWASRFSLHVILSQHGSFAHSSVVPQSHSSSSSMILLPQLRRSISSYSKIGIQKFTRAANNSKNKERKRERDVKIANRGERLHGGITSKYHEQIACFLFISFQWFELIPAQRYMQRIWMREIERDSKSGKTWWIQKSAGKT